MNKIKIDVKQASQFMAAGYEIECYVNVPKVKANSHRQPGVRTTAETRLAISLAGSPPEKGKYKEVWDKIDKCLWKGDVTKTFSRHSIENEIKATKITVDKSFISYLISQKKCLRVVEA